MLTKTLKKNKQRQAPVGEVIVLDLPAHMNLLNGADQCVLVHDLSHGNCLYAVSVISHHLAHSRTNRFTQHVQPFIITTN